jgi:hypothetical protein
MILRLLNILYDLDLDLQTDSYSILLVIQLDIDDFLLAQTKRLKKG